MKNCVFLGPSGSGKSEIAINLAIAAAAESAGEVHFFDMDQTKPLFRSRSCRRTLEKNGVVFHSGAEFLDVPVVPDGVAAFLRAQGCRCFLDMGGNIAGARSLGQFASLHDGNTRALYVVNVYRPFSDESSLRDDMDRILSSSRLASPHIVGNPNLGRETTLEEILEGHRRLEDMLERIGSPLDRLCVRLPLLEQARGRVNCPVTGITLHLHPGEVKPR